MMHLGGNTLPKIDEEFTPEEIERLIEDLNDTRMEFAERLGVRSVNTVFRWLRKEDPSHPQPIYRERMRHWRQQQDQGSKPGEQEQPPITSRPPGHSLDDREK